jgi:hypothetical protein
LGNDNSLPLIGPVIISEIHYHPRAPIDEFIELRNFASTNVALYDIAHPTNIWVLNGLGYTFPPNTTMAADSRLLLVADDPAAFRARHAFPPTCLFSDTQAACRIVAKIWNCSCRPRQRPTVFPIMRSIRSIQ